MTNFRSTPISLIAIVCLGMFGLGIVFSSAGLSDEAKSAKTTLQIRFTDSATGYAIRPDYITARSHRSGAEELRLDGLRSLEAGRASLDMEQGWYTITVKSPRHEPIVAEIEVREDNPHRLQFLLDPLEPPRELQPDYVEALHRDGATLIQGFIVDDESGEPLEDVRVLSLPGTVESISDARGFFQLHVPVPANPETATTSLIFEKESYRIEEKLHLELWSRGDWTYRVRLMRGSGWHRVDERDLRRELGATPPKGPIASHDQSSSEIQLAELSGTVSLVATVLSNATVRVPRNIRVLTRDGVTIDYVSMYTYARHVLPSEWYSSWHTNSLNAGAVALRSYAISRLNGRGPSSNYDICATSSCQVYRTDRQTTRTDNAVAFTENYVMINNSGNIASTEYSAENNSPAGNCGDGFTSPTGGCIYDPACVGETRFGHGRGLCQWGSARWASGYRLKGRSNGDTVSNGFPQRDWIWILNHYYPNLRLVKGAPLVIGDDVKSRSSDCQVRACPDNGIENGVSCVLITTKATGQTGVIIDGPVRVLADGKGFTWYQIQWNDANSTTGWSCENYIERVFPVPTAPANLTAVAVSLDQIDLSWTDTSDVETYFEIERAPGISGPWNLIGTVAQNVTSYSDKNLFEASTWCYRVRARNAGGTTSYTSVAVATTLGAVSPTLSAIPDQTITQGTLLTFFASANAPERVHLLADFEPFMSETANGVVLFQTPTHSGTTRDFINSAVNVGTNNLAAITDKYPANGDTTGKVLLVTCQFTNASNPWLRLTTDGTATLPNPIIDFTKKLRLKIRADRDIRVAIGCRETSTPAGTAIGSNGGISGAIEWVGVNNISGTAPVPVRSVPANVWTTLTFDFKSEPIRSFSDGDGILSTASGLGVLEHLAIVPMDGTGVYNVYLDDFTVVGPPRFLYSLGSGAPAGASIDPATGLFTWTPAHNQSPSTNSISVIVTDESLQSLKATNTFTVVVKDNVPNSPPMLAPIANRTVNAGMAVTFTNSAYDPNPGDTLTFSLDTGAPSAASMHPLTGVFTWITVEADANTTKTITARVTDDGTPPLSGATSFSVTVLPKNNPPILAPVNNRSVHAGSTISFTSVAYDPDSGDMLTFSLDPGAPTNASINPTNGFFTWTTTGAEANTINPIKVRVTDSGQPPLSGTTTFSVAVYAQLTIEEVTISEEDVTIRWGAIPDVTYRVQYKDDLHSTWQTLGQDITATNSLETVKDASLDSSLQRYYRLLIVD